ncbi:MAG: hypothetical protein OJF59_002486 [Cytophagales bacterium]|jgi:hypothetical protein|nr:hypothetical protein [Bacteroidota bacterium]MBS1980213.1 hypothetical protein [Bacteroidota bacterium]WHZ08732.1 MAG: hypothetical protein OJF59_002486 [Cytophagales bacterium]
MPATLSLQYKFLVMEPMKMISNASIKARIRQVVVLVILIIIGIAISKALGY